MDLQIIWGLVSPAQISVSDLSLKFLHLGHMRQTVLCGTRFLPLPSCVPQTSEQLQQRDKCVYPEEAKGWAKGLSNILPKF